MVDFNALAIFVASIGSTIAMIIYAIPRKADVLSSLTDASNASDKCLWTVIT